MTQVQQTHSTLNNRKLSVPEEFPLSIFYKLQNICLSSISQDDASEEPPKLP